MSGMDTVIYDKDGLIEKPCESCSIDTSGSTWKVCTQCRHERITVFKHGLLDRMFQSLGGDTVTGGHLHDLDYFKSIMDSLEEAKTVLTFLFHQKAGECIWHSYDSQAFETYCNHKEVSKEILDLEDCVKCPHYQTSEENGDSDPLTQELIERGERAPIDTKDLGSVKSGLRDEALVRLYQLERDGVFQSSLETRGNETRRIFTLVARGRGRT